MQWAGLYYMKQVAEAYQYVSVEASGSERAPRT